MNSDITTDTELTLTAATYNGRDKDEWSISRWSKKGDRLYLNGPAKFDKHSIYVDLEAQTVENAPSKTWDTDVTIEGTELTISIEKGIKASRKTLTFVVELSGDFEAEEEDDDESESVAVADGGSDDSDHVSDEEIVEAIDQHDDANHPDSNSVAEIRELLAHMQESVEAMWSEWMDNIENGDTMLVHEDDDCIIVSTGEHRMYDQELSTYEGDVEVDDITMSTVSQVHHNIAKRLTDYNWGYSYPFVIAKPADCNAGERLVEAHLMWLMDECDLSGGVALDYYMVEWRGLSQNAWSTRAGKDQGTVSQNIKTAKEHVVR